MKTTWKFIQFTGIITNIEDNFFSTDVNGIQVAIFMSNIGELKFFSKKTIENVGTEKITKMLNK